ncbi:hypothetical protein Acsp01_75320 [Actinoplanes sp. NBRC 101535]|nr:hypothetical protein Acsp01_75320 [Actinoplanes sp. NBRC 101535]
MKALTRRVTLWRADLEDAACGIPADIADAVGDREQIVVVLDHRTEGVTATKQTFDGARVRSADPDGGWRLAGLTWPSDVRTGTLVAVSWHPGREEIVLRTIPLDEPLRIDGVAYFHEFDPAVITRDFDPGISNRGQVLRTIRQLGRVYDDGSAVFPEVDLPKRSGLGRGAKGAFLLKNAVDQLIREGYVTRVPGSLDDEGKPVYPAAEGADVVDMLFYAPLIEPVDAPGEHGEGTGEGYDRRDHWVAGFIRKLPPGAEPSTKQLELHQRAVENEQIGSGALAPGYTFVKKHHRNG